jgi:hypothetical protein
MVFRCQSMSSHGDRPARQAVAHRRMRHGSTGDGPRPRGLSPGTSSPQPKRMGRYRAFPRAGARSCAPDSLEATPCSRAGRATPAGPSGWMLTRRLESFFGSRGFRRRGGAALEGCDPPLNRLDIDFGDRKSAERRDETALHDPPPVVRGPRAEPRLLVVQPRGVLQDAPRKSWVCGLSWSSAGVVAAEPKLRASARSRPGTGLKAALRLRRRTRGPVRVPNLGTFLSWPSRPVRGPPRKYAWAAQVRSWAPGGGWSPVTVAGAGSRSLAGERRAGGSGGASARP